MRPCARWSRRWGRWPAPEACLIDVARVTLATAVGGHPEAREGEAVAGVGVTHEKLAAALAEKEPLSARRRRHPRSDAA